MTDKELIRAVNIADVAMVEVVEELIDRNDPRARRFSSMNSAFCADLQRELGLEHELIDYSILAAAPKMLGKLRACINQLKHAPDLRREVVEMIHEATGGEVKR